MSGIKSNIKNLGQSFEKFKKLNESEQQQQPTTKPADRKPLYENEMCRSVGLIASCNSCDRIIFEDENHLEAYSTNGGYCKECAEEVD